MEDSIGVTHQQHADGRGRPAHGQHRRADGMGDEVSLAGDGLPWRELDEHHALGDFGQPIAGHLGDVAYAGDVVCPTIDRRPVADEVRHQG